MTSYPQLKESFSTDTKTRMETRLSKLESELETAAGRVKTLGAELERTRDTLAASEHREMSLRSELSAQKKAIGDMTAKLETAAKGGGDTTSLSALGPLNAWMDGLFKGTGGAAAGEDVSSPQAEDDDDTVERDDPRRYSGNVRFGDVAYLQHGGTTDRRWLTGGRGAGCRGLLTRDLAGSAYERASSRAYQWILRSGSGMERAASDPKAGVSIARGDSVWLQATGVDDRWVAAAGKGETVSAAAVESEENNTRLLEWVVRSDPDDYDDAPLEANDGSRYYLVYGDAVLLQSRNVPRGWLAGGLGRGNECVCTGDVAQGEEEGCPPSPSYRWIVRSEPGPGDTSTGTDPKSRPCLRYGARVRVRCAGPYHRRYLTAGGDPVMNDDDVSAREQRGNDPGDGGSSDPDDAGRVWTVRSQPGGREDDHQTGDRILYGDVVYLQVSGGGDRRWLSGGRGARHRNVHARDMLSTDYERRTAATTYQWIVRSSLRDGAGGKRADGKGTATNPRGTERDPLHGRTVNEMDKVRFQVKRLEDHWLVAAVGKGCGVETRDDSLSADESFQFQWVLVTNSATAKSDN